MPSGRPSRWRSRRNDLRFIAAMSNYLLTCNQRSMMDRAIDRLCRMTRGTRGFRAVVADLRMPPEHRGIQSTGDLFRTDHTGWNRRNVQYPPDRHRHQAARRIARRRHRGTGLSGDSAQRHRCRRSDPTVSGSRRAFPNDISGSAAQKTEKLANPVSDALLPGEATQSDVDAASNGRHSTSRARGEGTLERGRGLEICRRFEAELFDGLDPQIEDAIGDVAEPQRSALFSMLLAAELRFRVREDEQPTREEYRAGSPPILRSWMPCSTARLDRKRSAATA